MSEPSSIMIVRGAATLVAAVVGFAVNTSASSALQAQEEPRQSVPGMLQRPPDGEELGLPGLEEARMLPVVLLRGLPTTTT